VTRARGFTLLELLVATSVLAAVVLVATAGYGWFVSRWDNALGRVDSVAQQYQNQARVRRAISAVQVNYLRQTNVATTTVFPFFEGAANGFRSISHAPALINDSPAIIELRVVEDGDTQALEYREWSEAEALLRGPQQLQKPPRVLRVLDNVRGIRFRYYGFISLQQYLQQDDTNTQRLTRQWFDSYRGQDRLLLPERLEIRFTNAQDQPQRWLFAVPSASYVRPPDDEDGGI